MEKIAPKTMQREKQCPPKGEKRSFIWRKKLPYEDEKASQIEIVILCSQEGEGRAPTSLPLPHLVVGAHELMCL